jgi:hypothetical protein
MQGIGISIGWGGVTMELAEMNSTANRAKRKMLFFIVAPLSFADRLDCHS